MKNISEVLTGVKTMGIAGHIRPDGDCVGSCMALYLYVTEHFPEIDVRIYLDHPKPVFSHIDRIGDIRTETDGDREFDLFVTCDVSARDRLAVADEYFDRAKKTCLLYTSTYRPIEKQKEFSGILTAYDDNSVTIEEDGALRTFDKKEIALIRLKIEF